MLEKGERVICVWKQRIIRQSPPLAVRENPFEPEVVPSPNPFLPRTFLVGIQDFGLESCALRCQFYPQLELI